MKLGFSNRVISSRREMIFLFLFISIPLSLRAKSFSAPDTLDNNTVSVVKKENIFRRTANFINMLLEQDTFYVSPNKYNMSITPQYTYGYEYYRFSAPDKEQNITISPSSNNKIGLNLGWRWLSVGYSFTLNKIQPEFDMELNLYCVRAGLEFFYRKRNDGFKVHSIKGFYENEMPLTNYSRNFDGLSISQFGANAFYIFNYKRFSFPAAFTHSTNQRRNAGSFILGVNFHEQKFMFDHTKVDSKIERLMVPELKFERVNYMDLSINFGYSYNLVFAKDFVANISVLPAVGYKNTSLKSISNSKEFFTNINLDLVSRFAVVYNNSRYYVGASLVSNTYSYLKPSLLILNGFGYLKVYAGFNFWRRKHH